MDYQGENEKRTKWQKLLYMIFKLEIKNTLIYPTFKVSQLEAK